MPHHAAYRLYRHAEREGDVGPEVMPGDVFVPAVFSDSTVVVMMTGQTAARVPCMR